MVLPVVRNTVTELTFFYNNLGSIKGQFLFTGKKKANKITNETN